MSRHRTGARSSRRKRGLIRRFGIVFPAAVIATVAVIVVAVGAKVFAPRSGAFSAVQAIEMVPGSHTMAALESERAQLIAMTAAARTLTVVAKPKLASPADVAAANPGTGTGSGGGGIIYVTSTPPDPNTAQSIAYNLMASFGFSPSTYFGCLQDIWNRESGWRYDAENPASGAYGIPQSLPGSKMASAGRTGRPTRPLRSGGALATSRRSTGTRAVRGLLRKLTATTDHRATLTSCHGALTRRQ